jgi:hypothetical protein
MVGFAHGACKAAAADAATGVWVAPWQTGRHRKVCRLCCRCMCTIALPVCAALTSVRGLMVAGIQRCQVQCAAWGKLHGGRVCCCCGSFEHVLGVLMVGRLCPCVPGQINPSHSVCRLLPGMPVLGFQDTCPCNMLHQLQENAAWHPAPFTLQEFQQEHRFSAQAWRIGVLGLYIATARPGEPCCVLF